MQLFKEHFVIILLSVVLGQFVLAMPISMFIFPGYYNFFYEYVSALGMTVTPHTHMHNPYGSLIFNISLSVAIIGSFPFWLYRKKYVRGGNVGKNIALFISIGFTLGILGVALAPYNLFPYIHDISIYTGFTLGICGFCFFMLYSQRGYLSPKFILFWAIGSAFLVIGESIVYLLVVNGVLTRLPAFAIIQKFSIGFFLIWFLCEAFNFNRYLKNRCVYEKS